MKISCLIPIIVLSIVLPAFAYLAYKSGINEGYILGLKDGYIKCAKIIEGDQP